MKKDYQEPALEILILEQYDIITTSDDDDEQNWSPYH